MHLIKGCDDVDTRQWQDQLKKMICRDCGDSGNDGDSDFRLTFLWFFYSVLLCPCLESFRTPLSKLSNRSKY